MTIFLTEILPALVAGGVGYAIGTLHQINKGRTFKLDVNSRYGKDSLN